MSVLEDKYQAILAAGLDLGAPVGPEESLHDGGVAQTREYGRIWMNPRAGAAYEAHGAILARYLELEAELGPLGSPISDEQDDPAVPGGRMSVFEWGVIRWDPVSGLSVEAASFTLQPRVVVKLADDAVPVLGSGQETNIIGLAPALGSYVQTGDFLHLASALAEAPIRPVFGAIPGDTLTALTDAAAVRNPGRRAENLLSYLEIDVPAGIDPDYVAETLAGFSGAVATAFVSGEPVHPSVTGVTNPLFLTQGHLAPGPVGIGAAVAWAAGADGTGIRVIDIEEGWFLGHEDFQPLSIRLLGGISIPSSHAHGTAVLGIIMGRDNNLGGVGIAPAAGVDALSWAEPRQLTDRIILQTIAAKITAAAAMLSPGDVLCLQMSINRRVGDRIRPVPVETDADIRAAIRLATDLGIVVVEAAGNGSFDLDGFADLGGRRTLDPNHPDFEPTEAILVAACRSAVPHTVHDISNRGSRVDCHAWGDHVVTPGSFEQPANPFAYFSTPIPDEPDAPFGHTSGATAIITGVCVLVQHLRAILTPSDGSTGPLTSAGMRDLLRDDANGTPSFLTSDRIGPMPDLAKIIAGHFLP